MLIKHFSVCLVLVFVVCSELAAQMSPGIPSEGEAMQDDLLVQCDISGGQQGLTPGQIERLCPATSNALPVTLGRTNQGLLNDRVSPDNGLDDDIQQQTLGALLGGEQVGISAGSMLNAITVWASAAKSSTEYSLLPTESDTGAGMVGIHTAINDKSIIGISFGISGTSVDTFYNLGEQELTDYTLAIYGSTAITDNISVDINGGYMFREIDQFRTQALGAGIFGTPFTPGETVNGNTESDTWFVSANVNGFWQFDAFMFGLHSGVLYSEEDVDGFTETGAMSNMSAAIGAQTIQTGLFRAGIDIGYATPSFFEPFVGLEYLNYFEQEEIRPLSTTTVDNDDSEYQWSAGVRLFGDGVNGSITYRNNFSREFLDYDSLDFLISVDL